MITVTMLDGKVAQVFSFEEASKVVTDEIANLGLGASEWYGNGAGVVREDGETVARVSYNGRIWNLDGTERKS